MQLHYLEVVTPEVDATCATYAQLHGVTYGEPGAGLGNARPMALPGHDTFVIYIQGDIHHAPWQN